MTWRCAYFIEVMLNWLLPELWPFNNFSAVSIVSATPPTVFKGFWWNFPVIDPMTWRYAYHTEVTFDRFLPELWPFVSFSHFINRSSYLRNSSCSFQGILWNFPDIVAMTWRCAYFIEVMRDWFLTVLWPFNNFQQEVLSPQLLSQFPVDFRETFQLLFSWPEEDHVLPRSRLTASYQSYGPLSVLAILSTEGLVSATPPTVFKGFWWNLLDIVAMTSKRSYFIEVILNWFLPELWPFNYCSTVSLVSTTPLAVFSGF